MDERKGEAKSDAFKTRDIKKKPISRSDQEGEREGEGKKNNEPEPPRCSNPKCNSTQGHVRIRDGAFVCHRCGKVTIPERRK